MSHTFTNAMVMLYLALTSTRSPHLWQVWTGGHTALPTWGAALRSRQLPLSDCVGHVVTRCVGSARSGWRARLTYTT
ncbi:MAG: hypothetical protein QOJ32_1627, partial [Frankiaceae bacterium]|nr:hypothetical protein [Frankiaceae bacterium]